jgi:hypothetical protein
MDIDNKSNESKLDLLRADLVHQLQMPDDLDWDYFVETAERARNAANTEKRNMVEN